MRILLSFFLLGFLFATSSARADDASAEANKAVVRHAFAALEQGDIATLNAIFDPDGPWHLPSGATIKQGGPFADLRSSCPMCADLAGRKIVIDVILAEGDLVAVRSTWSGVYTGTWHGMAVAAKPVALVYSNIYRVSGGRIVENWASADSLALARQIGVTLAPAAK